MRILGVDHGDRNIGLALSDHLHITARPLGFYRLSSDKENALFFKNLTAQHDVGEIVVGLPLRMDGSSGSRADKTRDFAVWLEKSTGLPVIFWDERLTTHQAQGIMIEQKIKTRDKKEAEHQISAVIILMAYLERRRSGSHVPQNP